MIRHVLFPIALLGLLLPKTNGNFTITAHTFILDICASCHNSSTCAAGYTCKNDICIINECDENNKCPSDLNCIKASCCDESSFVWSSAAVSSACLNESCSDFYSVYASDTDSVCGADGNTYSNEVLALCAGTCVVECSKKKTGVAGFFQSWEDSYTKGHYLYYSIAVLVVVAICLVLICYFGIRMCRRAQRKESVYKIELQSQYSWGNENGQKRASYQM